MKNFPEAEGTDIARTRDSTSLAVAYNVAHPRILYKYIPRCARNGKIGYKLLTRIVRVARNESLSSFFAQSPCPSTSLQLNDKLSSETMPAVGRRARAPGTRQSTREREKESEKSQ
jgi:hypothetical protein